MATVEFINSGIGDSNISIRNIDDKITSSVSNRLKTTGDTMTELSLGENKITVLRDPTSAEDAANKQYVDAADKIISDTLPTLQVEHAILDDEYKKFRRNNYTPTLKIINDFFGNPRVVDMKLSEIKQSIDENTAGITEIENKVKFPAGVTQIKNISYTISSGQSTWTPQNNTFKYTAAITGVYRFTLFSMIRFASARATSPFSISFPGVINVITNNGSEETLTLLPADPTLPSITY